MALEIEDAFKRRWNAEINRTRRMFDQDAVYKLEWVIVDDHDTCDYCRRMNGRVFTLEEAESLDRHEGCRCILVPVLVKQKIHI